MKTRHAASLGLTLALALSGAPGETAAQPPNVGETGSIWQTPALSRVSGPSWLALGGEVRLRMESRRGLGYDAGASDTYVLVRTRLDVDVRPREGVRLFFQGQDSRAPGIRSDRASGVFRDPLELRQSYVTVGDARDGGVSLTVGRQLLLYGDQRLIGPLDWTNTSRAFDAARLEIRTSRVDIDVFSGAVVRNDPARALNRSDLDNGLHGVYGRVRTPSESVVVEPFVLWRTAPSASVEGGVGDADRFSGGLRIAGAGGGWDAAATYVEQWGTLAEADVEARSLSLAAGYTFPTAASPRLYAEYNFATGDRDPGDGVVEWFDDLFPTAHLYYGYNDLVGLRNIHNLRLGARVAVAGRLTLGLDVHGFRLASRNDHLYNVAGAVTVPASEGGAESRRVGEEVDLTFAVPVVSATLSASGGVGHLFPGPFLEAHSAGDGSTFGYVSLSFEF